MSELLSVCLEIAGDGRAVTILERPDGDFDVEWRRQDGDVFVRNRIGLTVEALAATTAAAMSILEQRGISVGPHSIVGGDV